MSDVLQTNECAYRACILYETLRGKPIEKSFKQMRKVMPTLDYVDFEYWYYRFLSGNHDLNHDRSTDPETRGLLDMPLDVVERITGNLDPFSLLSLRKVSRSLRSAVDSRRTRFGSVRLHFSRNATELAIGKHKTGHVDDQSIKYEYWEHKLSGFQVRNFFQNRKKQLEACWEPVRGKHRNLALKELLTLIKNPNWTFKSLQIGFIKNATWLKRFKSKLTSIKIRVEELRIDSETLAPMAALLPYFSSYVLKKICFGTNSINMKSFRRILKMDQWKNAEELHFENIPDEFDIEDLFHTRKFTIRRCWVNEERLLAIRDILLHSATVEECSLGGDRSFGASTNLTSTQVKNLLSQDPAFNNETWRYRVGTNHYYQIKYDFQSLDIQKIIV